MISLLTNAEWKEIDLEMIEFHPCLSDFLRDELSTMHLYSVERPDKLLTQEALKLVQSFYPIILIPGKKNKFYCITGIRLISIVRQVQRTGTVTAAIVKKLKTDSITRICFTDLYMAPFCYSLRSPGDLYLFSHKIPSEIMKLLMGKEADNAAAFAKALNLSRQTLYSKKARS